MFRKSVLVLALLLCVVSAYSDKEICIVDRSDIISRIENRSFPSLFGAWDYKIINHPKPFEVLDWETRKKLQTYNDLYWSGLFRGLHWDFDSGEYKITTVVGGVNYNLKVKSEMLELNPNFLFLVPLNVYGAYPQVYPDNWGYWLRDENGERIKDEGWAEYLIDYTLPGAIDHFVQRTVAIANCGLHDGIFIDWWSENPVFDVGPENIDHYFHGNRADALIELARRIRESVGDDFLIIVNTNTRKIPRSAPYINGAYMEVTSGGKPNGYTRDELMQIEDSLLWYENNLRQPTANCLEGWAIRTIPMNHERNLKQARAIITLGLTHSNSYITYSPGIVKINHEHFYEIWEGHYAEHDAGIPHGHTHQKYWYDFYNVDLGKPIGEKAKTYNGIDGLFIREFARGWAVYNRSGSEREVQFERHVIGKASEFGGTTHVIGDLDGEIYLKGNPHDINADGVINILDLVVVANALGSFGGVADVNGDGVVNILDLVLISSAF